MSCCVKVCKNLRRLLPPESEITFHRIPKKQYEQFSAIIGFDKKKYLAKHICICSEHFSKNDFNISQNNRKFLKKGALPRIGVNKDIKEENNDIKPNQDNGREIITLQLGTSTKSDILGYISLSSTSTSKSSSNESGCLPMSTATSADFLEPVSKTFKRRRESTNGTPTVSPGEDRNLKIMAKERLASQKTQDDSFSGSTSSGTRKKTVQFINNIHSYSVSPGKIKKSLDESKQKLKIAAKKLYLARKTINKLKREIYYLNEVVEDLKSTRMLSDNALDHLQRTADGVPKMRLVHYYTKS